MDFRCLTVLIVLMRTASCGIIRGCSVNASRGLSNAVQPLEYPATNNILVALGRGNSSRVFKEFCDSNATASTMGAVLKDLKLALRDCDQDITIYRLLGFTELRDIHDVCMYQPTCPSITANMVETGKCMAGLELSQEQHICPTANNTCSCIQQEAVACQAAAQSRLFQCRIKQTYDIAIEKGCESLVQCDQVLISSDIDCSAEGIISSTASVTTTTVSSTSGTTTTVSSTSGTTSTTSSTSGASQQLPAIILMVSLTSAHIRGMP